MGSGKEFADYAFGLFLEEHPSVELAAQLAVYVIDVTKDNIEGVGHFTDVHVIQSSGLHWSFSAPEVREIEGAFDEFFKTLRYVIHVADSKATSEELIPVMLNSLGDKVKTLRAAQDKRMALRAKWRQEDSPSPAPTKDDS